jgi:hypothetical protein
MAKTAMTETTVEICSFEHWSFEFVCLFGIWNLELGAFDFVQSP